MFDKIQKSDISEDTDFVIFGVPFEATSTSPRSGAKVAPSAIRKAFDLFSLLTESGIDIFQKKVVDIGDIEVYPSLIEETLQAVDEIIALILSSNHNNPPIPVILGGDHFITYPIIRSLLQSYNQKIGIIILDAHVDLYDKWLFKEQYAHCTVFHRILDLPMINPEDLIYIGIRDVDYEEAEFLKQNKINLIAAHTITETNLTSLLTERFKSFHERKIERVYVSIDIDVLDPSCAPGTGYPIPGGLSYRQLWNSLQLISKNFKIIGFDMVEVCPPYDSSEITSITAARLIMEFLGFIVKAMK